MLKNKASTIQRTFIPMLMRLFLARTSYIIHTAHITAIIHKMVLSNAIFHLLEY